MIIDLRAFKQKGLSTGNFNFDFLPDDALLPSPDQKFCKGTSVSGSFEIVGRDVYLNGELKLVVSGACARCQERTTTVVSLEFDEKFVIYNDEECYFYSKDCIDVTKMVNDMILSQAPMCIYCFDDCKGLCPVCGANLNNGKCGCEN